jgi:hypothetical protein
MRQSQLSLCHNQGTTRVKQALSRCAAQLHEVELARPDEGLGAALDRELAEDVVDVLLDGANGNHQSGGDRLIGGADGNQPQDVEFARAQRFDDRVWWRACGSVLRWLGPLGRGTAERRRWGGGQEGCGIRRD